MFETKQNKSDTRRIGWGGQAAIRRLGEVGVWKANAAVHGGHVFKQLAYVLELASTACDHDATNEFAFQSAVLDFVVDVFDDFGHPGLDDARDVAARHFLGRASR